MELLRGAGAGERELEIGKPDDVLERRDVRSRVLQFRGREPHAVAVRMPRPDEGHALGFVVGQGAEEHGIDDRKDRGDGAGAQGYP